MPMTADDDAFQRLAATGARLDMPTAAATVAAVAERVGAGTGEATAAGPDQAELLDALILLRWTQAELAALEPALIAAARAAGASWQLLAPALGVASRQAAERRYLRLVPATVEQHGSTREERVLAERDRRAGIRAVAQWANDNTADLRRLAGQITALTDLDVTADGDLARLHQALADPDATNLPTLLADTHRHLDQHPELAARIDTVTTQTDRIRRHNQHHRRESRSASGEA
jgi:hypothetical protein